MIRQISNKERIERLNEILLLYASTYSTGDAAQKIDLEMVRNKLIAMPEEKLWLYVVEIDDKIVASLWANTLDTQNDIKVKFDNSIETEKCIYISEVFVDKAFRGKGFGKKLLEQFISDCQNSNYNDLMIRVWEKNLVALKLYVDVGFTTIESEIQTKKNVTDNNDFEMKKLYLHKKIHT